MTYKQLIQTMAINDFDEIKFTRHNGCETVITVSKGDHEKTKTVLDDVVYRLSADVVEWHVERLVNEVKADAD